MSHFELAFVQLYFWMTYWNKTGMKFYKKNPSSTALTAWRWSLNNNNLKKPKTTTNKQQKWFDTDHVTIKQR